MISRAFSIICIEDHKDTTDLLSVMLESHNPDYKVFSAQNGNEARTFIRERKFDLYVIDFKLPDMSGVDLCREIRQSDNRTPIIFFTGMARESDRKQAMEAGANAFLVKVRDVDKLTETIDYLLQANQVNPN